MSLSAMFALRRMLVSRAVNKTLGSVIQKELVSCQRVCTATDHAAFLQNTFCTFSQLQGKFMVNLDGMPFGTTEETIKDFLDNPDSIKDVDIRNNGGSCYVELLDEAAVDQALAKDREYIGERFVKVKNVDENWQDEVQKSKYSIKMFGFSYGTKKEDILNFLGDICVPDGVNGISVMDIGEMRVNLKDKESVEAALQLDKTFIGKRRVHVKKLDPKEFLQKIHQQVLAVELVGLPYDVSKEDIFEFFSGIKIKNQLDGIELRGKSAIVHLCDLDDYQNALKKSRDYIGHRYIFVNPVMKSRRFGQNSDSSSKTESSTPYSSNPQWL